MLQNRSKGLQIVYLALVIAGLIVRQVGFIGGS